MSDTVQLGQAFKRPPPDYGPLAELVQGLRGAITDDVRTALYAEVVTLISQMVTQLPPPQVSVQPAQVSVSPNIRVDVPGEDDQGEIEAADRQTDMLRQIMVKLDSLHSLMARPVVKEVTRDNNGQIIRVTETR